MRDTKMLRFAPVMDPARQEPGGAVAIGRKDRYCQHDGACANMCKPSEERAKTKSDSVTGGDQLANPATDGLQSSAEATSRARSGGKIAASALPVIEAGEKVSRHRQEYRLEMARLRAEVLFLKEEVALLRQQLSEANSQKYLELARNNLFY